jgi:hypothetical protein
MGEKEKTKQARKLEKENRERRNMHGSGFSPKR